MAHRPDVDDRQFWQRPDPRRAAALAKHYGAQIAVCPPNRPQRKGPVERGIGYLTQSWWRSAPVATPAQAQADLDRWSASVADRRRRGSETVAQIADREPLLSLPATPFPAELRAERVVSRSALVAFEGNRYSVGPELCGQTVEVRARLRGHDHAATVVDLQAYAELAKAVSGR